MSILVIKPEHNELARFQSMRLSPYSTAEVLAELIDNSNSARRKDQDVVRVDINIFQDPLTKQYILSIQDNASGIIDTDLGKVLGQANSIGGGTNNEHGMGLKQAAFTGTTYLRSIETKTLSALTSRKAEFKKAEDVLDSFEVKDASILKGVGTRLEIVLPDEHPLLIKDEYYNALSELQLIYQKVLDNTLRVTAKNDVLGLPPLNLQADSAITQLYNPVKKEQSWILDKVFKGINAAWTASVRVGFIDDASYKRNLSTTFGAVSIPTDKTRHGRGIEKQGIFIFKGDRMIQKTNDWSLESSQNILDGRLGPLHNSLNGLVLEIHFDKNFPTTPTKNRLKLDASLVEFRDQLIEYFRRFQPDTPKGAPTQQSDSLYKYLLTWNNIKKIVLDPAQDLPWHHKQVKFQKDWVSIGKFGSWPLWKHGSKVIAFHKNGFDAPIPPSDIPEIKALSNYIKTKTKGAVTLPIFVHNNIAALDFTHYSLQYQPKVVTVHEATKEIARGELSLNADQQAMENAVSIVMGLKASMISLPADLRRVVMSTVSTDMGIGV